LGKLEQCEYRLDNPTIIDNSIWLNSSFFQETLKHLGAKCHNDYNFRKNKMSQ
jgi:hypothetical protein